MKNDVGHFDYLISLATRLLAKVQNILYARFSMGLYDGKSFAWLSWGDSVRKLELVQSWAKTFRVYLMCS